MSARQLICKGKTYGARFALNKSDSGRSYLVDGQLTLF